MKNIELMRCFTAFKHGAKSGNYSQNSGAADDADNQAGTVEDPAVEPVHLC